MPSRNWEQRNQRARELGYDNYYDYRRHGYGAIPPDEQALRGEGLARIMGHRGESDLRREAEPGDHVVLFTGTSRDGHPTATFLRIPADGGREVEYRIVWRGDADAWTDYLDSLIDDLESLDIEVEGS